MNGLMMALYTSWSELADKVGWAEDWLPDLLEVLESVLWVGLAIAGAAGAIYAIWIGIKMAKAESSDEREEAKKHLINVIIAIVCVIVLIVVFLVLVPMIVGAVVGSSDDLTTGGTDGQAIKTLVGTMKCLVR